MCEVAEFHSCGFLARVMDCARDPDFRRIEGTHPAVILDDVLPARRQMLCRIGAGIGAAAISATITPTAREADALDPSLRTPPPSLVLQRCTTLALSTSPVLQSLG